MTTIIAARHKYIRFARSILVNLQDAEDVVQDCYIRLYERNSAGTIDNTDAYMMRSVRNASLDCLKQRRPDALAERHEEVIEIPAEVLRSIEQREHAQRLEQLMALLSEKQRSVFYLRDVEGYELQEIEAVTGMSNEAIRTSLSRARKQLRELYNKIR